MADDPGRKSFTYPYPRPSVTVDVALVRRWEHEVLLIRRRNEPFAGCWALPGGFVDENEPLIEAARRELKEETGLEGIELQQLQTFGDPGRDPRGWTVSVVYLARLAWEQLRPQAGDDAADVAWFPFDALPTLAFDHEQILTLVQDVIARE